MQKILLMITILMLAPQLGAMEVSDETKALITALQDMHPESRNSRNAENRMEQVCKNNVEVTLWEDEQQAIKQELDKTVNAINATATFTPWQATKTWAHSFVTSPFLYVAAACGITGYALNNGYITKDIVAPYINAKTLAAITPLALATTAQVATAGTLAHATYNTYSAYDFVRKHKSHYELCNNATIGKINRLYSPFINGPKGWRS